MPAPRVAELTYSREIQWKVPALCEVVMSCVSYRLVVVERCRNRQFNFPVMIMLFERQEVDLQWVSHSLLVFVRISAGCTDGASCIFS